MEEGRRKGSGRGGAGDWVRGSGEGYRGIQKKVWMAAEASKVSGDGIEKGREQRRAREGGEGGREDAPAVI